MARSAHHPVRVQPFFGYRSHERLVLDARALRSAALNYDPGPRLRAVRTMLAQFAPRRAPGLRVRLELTGPAGEHVVSETVAGRSGFLRFDLPLEPAWSLPEQPMWERAELSWPTGSGRRTIEAHVLVPGRNSDLAVISDIDDTIIETGITGGLASLARNWRRLFAQWPHERLAAPGADLFYGALGGGTGPGIAPGQSLAATRRPFFYVSSSPWNLFDYLVAFQRHKGLPLGPLLLRQWGLNRRTLGGASHGAHKREAIDSILRHFPTLRFALIGDDTQGDIPAFARIIGAHPGRVAAVFLRTITDQSFTDEEQAALALIRAAGVPLWLGDRFEVGLAFLRALGFTPGGETEQIVRAVEQVEPNAHLPSEPGPTSARRAG